MARESKDLRIFKEGLISNVSSQDSPDEAAGYSENVNPESEGGTVSSITGNKILGASGFTSPEVNTYTLKIPHCVGGDTTQTYNGHIQQYNWQSSQWDGRYFILKPQQGLPAVVCILNTIPAAWDLVNMIEDADNPWTQASITQVTHLNVAPTGTSGTGDGALRATLLLGRNSHINSEKHVVCWITNFGAGYKAGDTIEFTDPGATSNKVVYTLKEKKSTTIVDDLPNHTISIGGSDIPLPDYVGFNSVDGKINHRVYDCSSTGTNPYTIAVTLGGLLASDEKVNKFFDVTLDTLFVEDSTANITEDSITVTHDGLSTYLVGSGIFSSASTKFYRSTVVTKVVDSTTFEISAPALATGTDVTIKQIRSNIIIKPKQFIDKDSVVGPLDAIKGYTGNSYNQYGEATNPPVVGNHEEESNAKYGIYQTRIHPSYDSTRTSVKIVFSNTSSFEGDFPLINPTSIFTQGSHMKITGNLAIPDGVYGVDYIDDDDIRISVENPSGVARGAVYNASTSTDYAYNYFTSISYEKTDSSGLSTGTQYSFKITQRLIGASEDLPEQEILFTTDGSNVLWGNGSDDDGVLHKMNTALEANAVLEDVVAMIFNDPDDDGAIKFNSSPSEYIKHADGVTATNMFGQGVIPARASQNDPVANLYRSGELGYAQITNYNMDLKEGRIDFTTNTGSGLKISATDIGIVGGNKGSDLIAFDRENNTIGTIEDIDNENDVSNSLVIHKSGINHDGAASFIKINNETRIGLGSGRGAKPLWAGRIKRKQLDKDINEFVIANQELDRPPTELSGYNFEQVVVPYLPTFDEMGMRWWQSQVIDSYYDDNGSQPTLVSTNFIGDQDTNTTIQYFDTATGSGTINHNAFKYAGPAMTTKLVMENNLGYVDFGVNASTSGPSANNTQEGFKGAFGYNKGGTNSDYIDNCQNVVTMALNNCSTIDSSDNELEGQGGWRGNIGPYQGLAFVVGNPPAWLSNSDEDSLLYSKNRDFGLGGTVIQGDAFVITEINPDANGHPSSIRFRYLGNVNSGQTAATSDWHEGHGVGPAFALGFSAGGNHISVVNLNPMADKSVITSTDNIAADSFWNLKTGDLLANDLTGTIGSIAFDSAYVDSVLDGNDKKRKVNIRFSNILISDRRKNDVLYRVNWDQATKASPDPVNSTVHPKVTLDFSKLPATLKRTGQVIVEPHPNDPNSIDDSWERVPKDAYISDIVQTWSRKDIVEEKIIAEKNRFMHGKSVDSHGWTEYHTASAVPGVSVSNHQGNFYLKCVTTTTTNEQGVQLPYNQTDATNSGDVARYTLAFNFTCDSALDGETFKADWGDDASGPHAFTAPSGDDTRIYIRNINPGSFGTTADNIKIFTESSTAGTFYISEISLIRDIGPKPLVEDSQTGLFSALDFRYEDNSAAGLAQGSYEPNGSWITWVLYSKLNPEDEFTRWDMFLYNYESTGHTAAPNKLWLDPDGSSAVFVKDRTPPYQECAQHTRLEQSDGWGHSSDNSTIYHPRHRFYHGGPEPSSSACWIGDGHTSHQGQTKYFGFRNNKYAGMTDLQSWVVCPADWHNTGSDRTVYLPKNIGFHHNNPRSVKVFKNTLAAYEPRFECVLDNQGQKVSTDTNIKGNPLWGYGLGHRVMFASKVSGGFVDYGGGYMKAADGWVDKWDAHPTQEWWSFEGGGSITTYNNEPKIFTVKEISCKTYEHPTDHYDSGGERELGSVAFGGYGGDWNGIGQLSIDNQNSDSASSHYRADGDYIYINRSWCAQRGSDLNGNSHSITTYASPASNFSNTRQSAVFGILPTANTSADKRNDVANRVGASITKMRYNGSRILDTASNPLYGDVAEYYTGSDANGYASVGVVVYELDPLITMNSFDNISGKDIGAITNLETINVPLVTGSNNIRVDYKRILMVTTRTEPSDEVPSEIILQSIEMNRFSCYSEASSVPAPTPTTFLGAAPTNYVIPSSKLTAQNYGNNHHIMAGNIQGLEEKTFLTKKGLDYSQDFNLSDACEIGTFKNAGDGTSGKEGYYVFSNPHLTFINTMRHMQGQKFTPDHYLVGQSSPMQGGVALGAYNPAIFGLNTVGDKSIYTRIGEHHDFKGNLTNTDETVNTLVPSPNPIIEEWRTDRSNASQTLTISTKDPSLSYIDPGTTIVSTTGGVNTTAFEMSEPANITEAGVDLVLSRFHGMIPFDGPSYPSDASVQENFQTGAMKTTFNDASDGNSPEGKLVIPLRKNENPIQEQNNFLTIDTEGSVEGEGFEEGSILYYKVSLTYDGTQEGPLSSWAVTMLPLASSKETIKLILRTSGVDAMGLSERVSHINIYWTDDLFLKQYTLAKSLELDTGLNSAWWYDSEAEKWQISFSHIYAGSTYESINGISQNRQRTMLNWKIGDVGGPYLFVTQASHPNVPEDITNYIYRSKAGLPDVFDITANYLMMPTKIIALKSFKGRLYAWDRNNTYVINQEGMFIEDTYKGIGILNDTAVVVTDYGMCFADANNIYLHDGVRANPIGTPILRNFLHQEWSVGFMKQVKIAEDLGYKIRIFYDGEAHTFIVTTKGFCQGTCEYWTAEKNGHLGYAFNILHQRWDLWKLPDVIAMTEGVDSKVYLADGKNLFQFRTDGFASEFWEWESKDLTMGEDAREKVFNKVKITGRPGVYKYDASTSAWSADISDTTPSIQDSIRVYVDGIQKALTLETKNFSETTVEQFSVFGGNASLTTGSISYATNKTQDFPWPLQVGMILKFYHASVGTEFAVIKTATENEANGENMDFTLSRGAYGTTALDFSSNNAAVTVIGPSFKLPRGTKGEKIRVRLLKQKGYLDSIRIIYRRKGMK